MALKQKIIPFFLGLCVALVLLEAGLRVGGWTVSSLQAAGNLRSVRQKGAYRILCIGESTTAGQYPSHLEEVLNERRIGVRFSVIDKGQSAIDTNYLLDHIESYLAEFHPDMVVAMMGMNDQGVKYYEGLPDSDSWWFRHCRLYRFSRILWMNFWKKTAGKEGGPGAAEKTAPEAAAGAGPRARLDPKKAAQAEAILEESLLRDPGNEIAYADLEKLYRLQGRSFQAVDFFKRTVRRKPEDDRAYVALGRAYLIAGQAVRGERAFEKALELNPRNGNASLGLGYYYQGRGDIARAEASFKKAIEADPQNPGAYAGLGWFYRFLNRPSVAEAAFKKSLELDPAQPKVCTEMGQLYGERNDLPQAEAFFRKAISLDPENENATLPLGGLYRRQNKMSQAEEVFKNALKIHPENDRVLAALASLDQEMGRPELAQEYAGKAARLRSGSLSAVTVRNYHKLKNILDRKGIKLVCVQYPVRNAGPLKRIFENEGGVLFVDNEAVFKNAIKQGRYQDYFIDMFGGDFGHCTPRGNRLLARNIAGVILKEVFHR